MQFQLEANMFFEAEDANEASIKLSRYFEWMAEAFDEDGKEEDSPLDLLAGSSVELKPVEEDTDGGG
jgi:hypothetical protein